MAVINILVIGVGRHAKRIYIPALSNLGGKVKIVGLVDLKSNERSVRKFLKENNLSIPTLFTNKLNIIPDDLNQFAKHNKVKAVAICTDPEAHVMYGKWSLANGYHVIMDKPIHASRNAAHDKWAARDIHIKYIDLLKDYEKLRKKYKGLRCEILTQRRFHPSYRLIKQTIDDVFNRTNCPVTYYYSFHSDGQWRMPSEIESIDYHGYTNGYGKASHSGYHFYDLFAWLTESCRNISELGTIQIDSWANYPSNYLQQLSPTILSKVFGSKSHDFTIQSDTSKFGEIDVFCRLLLGDGSAVKTVAEIDLLHSGLSARYWQNTGSRDLYKGNGRLRHEQLYISLGPFMSISLTSWQGIQFGLENQTTDSIFNPGHEFHVDVTIFKNSKLIGGKPIETFSLKDIYTPSLTDYSRGHQEDARLTGIRQFVNSIDEPDTITYSSLETHELSSQIMSSVYESLSTEDRVELPLNKEVI